MERMVIESTKPPEWLRTFFIADDGEIYLPCGAFVEETTALLALAFDGLSFVTDDGHPYAPVDWLSKNYPRYATTIEAIENQARRLHETGRRGNEVT